MVWTQTILISKFEDGIGAGADISITSQFVASGDDSTAPYFRRMLSRGAAICFRAALPINVCAQHKAIYTSGASSRPTTRSRTEPQLVLEPLESIGHAFKKTQQASQFPLRERLGLWQEPTRLPSYPQESPGSPRHG